ncbi:hypothetical protein FJ365_00615 [Candidatus Dependentiae bacterium]|nr:hypothetical protein [Candidatus Dependentiae bacterium]
MEAAASSGVALEKLDALIEEIEQQGQKILEANKHADRALFDNLKSQRDAIQHERLRAEKELPLIDLQTRLVALGSHIMQKQGLIDCCYECDNKQEALEYLEALIPFKKQFARLFKQLVAKGESLTVEDLKVLDMKALFLAHYQAENASVDITNKITTNQWEVLLSRGIVASSVAFIGTASCTVGEEPVPKV